METVLEVEGVSKFYATRLRHALRYGLDGMVRAIFGRARPEHPRPGEFRALDNVSFTLRRGEALAILGSNGSGKSTLLKTIYGILKPDRGEVRRYGRAYGLIELGAWFEPRLSGRENIALWAAMQRVDGTARKQMREAAAEFSELGDDLDKPVQSFSSGMRARLSFAMAASAGADLLIIDEALAVGDIGFALKCNAFLRTFLQQGGALLLTSHQSIVVESLCGRALVLEQGRSVFAGSSTDAVAYLLRHSEAPPRPREWESAEHTGIAITAAEATAVGGGPGRVGEPLIIRLHYRATRPLLLMWSYGVWTIDGAACILADTAPESLAIEPGEGELVCSIPQPNLAAGRYQLGVNLGDPRSMMGLAQLGWEGGGVPFEMTEPPSAQANIRRHLNQLTMVETIWGMNAEDAAAERAQLVGGHAS